MKDFQNELEIVELEERLEMVVADRCFIGSGGK